MWTLKLLSGSNDVELGDIVLVNWKQLPEYIFAFLESLPVG